MIRWWDDPDAALEVLGRVDGSDVEQGVGTAVLGLHALSKAALAPLVGATLVDELAVRQALFDVDYSPVSKALAAATEPIMGEASEEYGRSLARKMHAESLVGASAMVKSLTAAGVPMPLAIERAAEAVGLPAKQTGQYVSQMKAPAVVPVVRADAADRALMDFARDAGHLEAIAPVPDTVSKSAGFEEAEHPRDQTGRFTDKPDIPDERAERAARRSRRMRRPTAVAAPPPVEAARESGTLMDLAALLRPAPLREQQLRDAPLREHTPLTAVASRAKEIVARKPKPPAPAPEPEQAKAVKFLLKPAEVATPQSTTVVELGDNENHIVLLSLDDAEEIMDAGGFVVQRLAQLMLDGRDNDIWVAPASHAEDAFVDAQARGANMGQMVAIEFTGRVPIIDGGPGGEGMRLDPRARFKATNVNTANWDVLAVHEAPPSYDEAQAGVFGVMNPLAHRMPVLRMRLDNEKDFPGVTRHDVGKAVTRIEVWDSEGQRRNRVVARDDDGQFAATPGDDDRAARAARRARRMRREPPALAAPIPKGGTLIDLAALARTQADTPLREQPLREAPLKDAPLREAPKPKTQASPKPKAAVQAVSEKPELKELGTDRGMAARDATALSMNEFRMLFGEAADAVLDGALIETRADFEMPVPIATRPAVETLMDWVDQGSGEWNGESTPDKDEAIAQVRSHLRRYGRGYPGASEDTDYAPRATLHRHQNQAGEQVWTPRVVYYDRGKVILLGTARAMRDFKAGRPVELRSHTETNVHDLAEAYGDPRQMFGSHDAHVVAVEVLSPDDESARL